MTEQEQPEQNGSDGPRVLNPEAIGNPDVMPIVDMPLAMLELMNPCECGGLNGYHAERCRK